MSTRSLPSWWWVPAMLSVLVGLYIRNALGGVGGPLYCRCIGLYALCGFRQSCVARCVIVVPGAAIFLAGLIAGWLASQAARFGPVTVGNWRWWLVSVLVGLLFGVAFAVANAFSTAGAHLLQFYGPEDVPRVMDWVEHHGSSGCAVPPPWRLDAHK